MNPKKLLTQRIYRRLMCLYVEVCKISIETKRMWILGIQKQIKLPPGRLSGNKQYGIQCLGEIGPEPNTNKPSPCWVEVTVKLMLVEG